MASNSFVSNRRPGNYNNPQQQFNPWQSQKQNYQQRQYGGGGGGGKDEYTYLAQGPCFAVETDEGKYYCDRCGETCFVTVSKTGNTYARCDTCKLKCPYHPVVPDNRPQNQFNKRVRADPPDNSQRIRPTPVADDGSDSRFAELHKRFDNLESLIGSLVETNNQMMEALMGKEERQELYKEQVLKA